MGPGWGLAWDWRKGARVRRGCSRRCDREAGWEGWGTLACWQGGSEDSMSTQVRASTGQRRVIYGRAAPRWTPGHREEFKPWSLRDPQDHQEDGPGGAACCLPHKDPLG